jgi:hypothetical protein
VLFRSGAPPVAEGGGAFDGFLGGDEGGLVLASYSRGQELEADEVGQEVAASAGWDPAAKAPKIRAALLVRAPGAATGSPPPLCEGAATGSMRPLSLLAFIECRTA